LIHDSYEEDLEFINGFIKQTDDFITKNIVSRLLPPSKKCGPDGFLVLKCDDGSKKKYVVFIVGIKYSLDSVSTTERYKNENSTLLSNFFQKVKDRKPLIDSFTHSLVEKDTGDEKDGIVIDGRLLQL